MKKITAIFCLFATATMLHSRADVTVVEHVHSEKGAPAGPGPAQPDKDITLQIKGDKVRISDADGQISVILDTASGDIIALVHASKMCIKLPGDQVKTFITQAMQQHPEAAAGEAPKITDTGKQEKVGDYNAEIYTVETPKAKTTFWASKDVPEFAAIQGTVTKFMGLLAKIGIPNLPDVSKVDGAAVKVSVTTLHGGGTITLVSVKKDPIDDSNFQTPADYKEVKFQELMQSMMQGAMGAGGPGGPGGQPPMMGVPPDNGGAPVAPPAPPQ